MVLLYVSFSPGVTRSLVQFPELVLRMYRDRLLSKIACRSHVSTSGKISSGSKRPFPWANCFSSAGMRLALCAQSGICSREEIV